MLCVCVCMCMCVFVKVYIYKYVNYNRLKGVFRFKYITGINGKDKRDDLSYRETAAASSHYC